MACSEDEGEVRKSGDMRLALGFRSAGPAPLRHATRPTSRKRRGRRLGSRPPKAAMKEAKACLLQAECTRVMPGRAVWRLPRKARAMVVAMHRPALPLVYDVLGMARGRAMR